MIGGRDVARKQNLRWRPPTYHFYSWFRFSHVAFIGDPRMHQPDTKFQRNRTIRIVELIDIYFWQGLFGCSKSEHTKTSTSTSTVNTSNEIQGRPTGCLMSVTDRIGIWGIFACMASHCKNSAVSKPQMCSCWHCQIAAAAAAAAEAVVAWHDVVQIPKCHMFFVNRSDSHSFYVSGIKAIVFN